MQLNRQRTDKQAMDKQAMDKQAMDKQPTRKMRGQQKNQGKNTVTVLQLEKT